MLEKLLAFSAFYKHVQASPVRRHDPCTEIVYLCQGLDVCVSKLALLSYHRH